MSGTRGCVLVCGAALILAGLGEMTLGSVEASGFPSIPALLLGCVIVITAIAEPVYGRLTGRPPLSGGWQPTSERFIDPATGKHVEVWFEPKSGERRYVEIENEIEDKGKRE